MTKNSQQFTKDIKIDAVQVSFKPGMTLDNVAQKFGCSTRSIASWRADPEIFQAAEELYREKQTEKRETVTQRIAEAGPRDNRAIIEEITQQANECVHYAALEANPHARLKILKEAAEVINKVVAVERKLTKAETPEEEDDELEWM